MNNCTLHKFKTGFNLKISLIAMTVTLRRITLFLSFHLLQHKDESVAVTRSADIRFHHTTWTLRYECHYGHTVVLSRAFFRAGWTTKLLRVEQGLEISNSHTTELRYTTVVQRHESIWNILTSDKQTPTEVCEERILPAGG